MEPLVNAITVVVLVLFTIALFTLLVAAVGIDLRHRSRDKKQP